MTDKGNQFNAAGAAQDSDPLGTHVHYYWSTKRKNEDGSQIPSVSGFIRDVCNPNFRYVLKDGTVNTNNPNLKTIGSIQEPEAAEYYTKLLQGITTLKPHLSQTTIQSITPVVVALSDKLKSQHPRLYQRVEDAKVMRDFYARNVETKAPHSTEVNWSYREGSRKPPVAHIADFIRDFCSPRYDLVLPDGKINTDYTMMGRIFKGGPGSITEKGSREAAEHYTGLCRELIMLKPHLNKAADESLRPFVVAISGALKTAHPDLHQTLVDARKALPSAPQTGSPAPAI